MRITEQRRLSPALSACRRSSFSLILRELSIAGLFARSGAGAGGLGCLATGGHLLAGAPCQGFLEARAAAGFGENAVLHYLAVETPEQAIDALVVVRKDDGGHAVY